MCLWHSMRRLHAAWSLPLLLAPVLGGCSSTAPEPAPWAASYADDDHVYNARLAVDGSGTVALAGQFSGDLQLGPEPLVGGSFGDAGIFVGLLEPSGHVSWTKEIAAGGAFGTTTVAFSPEGDVIVAGGFDETVDFGTGPLGGETSSQGIFVAKLGRDGHPLWVQRFEGEVTDSGPGSAYLQAMAVDGAGNIALGGSLRGAFSFGGPPLDASASYGSLSFVVKLDRDGNKVFGTLFEGTSHSVQGLAFDGAGSLLVGGTNNGTLEIGGGKFTASPSNGFAAKLDPEGTPVWAFQLGGSSLVTQVAVDAAGTVLVGGSFNSELLAGIVQIAGGTGQDGFVLGVRPDGRPTWGKRLASAQVTGLAADGTDVLVTGTYEGSADFGAGPLPQASYLGAAFVTRLGAAGGHVSTVTPALLDLSSTDPQASTGSAIGVAGSDIVVTGTFGGALEFGKTTLQALGPADLFAARLSL